MIYNLSRDYSRLYDLLCKGEEVVCFVTYFKNHKEVPQRFIILPQRLKEMVIDWGHSEKWHLYSQWWNQKFGNVEPLEYGCFFNHCQLLNLEWIDPGNEGDVQIWKRLYHNRGKIMNDWIERFHLPIAMGFYDEGQIDPEPKVIEETE